MSYNYDIEQHSSHDHQICTSLIPTTSTCMHASSYRVISAFLRCAGLPRVPDETNLAKEPDTKAAEIDVPVATMTPAGSSEGTVTCTPFV